LERVLIVDDTRHKASRNYGNAICNMLFGGGRSDAELPLPLKHLETLAPVENFMTIERRGWRSEGAWSRVVGNENINYSPDFKAVR
jgi:hypothetical protein